MAAAGENSAKTIDEIVRRVLSRVASEKERQILEASRKAFQAYYTREPKEADALLNVGDTRPAATVSAPALAAWTMVCNQVLNLDETLNK